MSPEHSPESKEIFSRFGKLLVGLVTNKIDFAIVGGVAVIFNGFRAAWGFTGNPLQILLRRKAG